MYCFDLEKVDLVIIYFRWTDITKIEKSNHVLLPENMYVRTRDKEYVFSGFMHFKEAFALSQQMANLAMRKLIQDDSYQRVIEIVIFYQ